MKERVPFVSIIVVNYNGSRYLQGCFDALLKLNYPAESIEFLMVDNCSDDDSVNLVQNTFPAIRIFKNDINNYARANNLGIKNAKGDFIAFINNDIQVSGNWLVELINIMSKEKRAGVAGGKILLEDGRIQSAGHEEYPDFYWGDRGYRYEDKGQYEGVEDVPSLCGAAVLYRKSCLDDIDLFDEDFVMYLEDVDMCFRAAKKKWKIIYVSRSLATHHFRGTSSVESVRYFSERNRLLLIAKHFPKHLGKALYGKGYFTRENNIYDILPLVFNKLLESRKMADFKTDAVVIFENLKKFSVLEKSVLMEEIGGCKNVIAQKEASLAELNRVNAQLHEQINQALREKESSVAEQARSNARLNEQIQKMVNDLKLRDTALQEQEDSKAELARSNAQLNEQIQKTVNELILSDTALREKEDSLAELARGNVQLNGTIKEALRDLELKDAVLREKEASLAELVRTNAQLNELIKKTEEAFLAEVNKTVHELGLKDAALREKDTSLADLNRANAQLNEQVQKTAHDLALKDEVLREKEASLTEHARANAQLTDRINKAVSDIESKNSLLSEKQAVIDQKVLQLHGLKEELILSKADLDKIVRFDQRMKILLLKPQRISIADTEETVRIIKRKYPNSSIYLFANLVRPEYEMLTKNMNVDMGLVYARDGAKSFIESAKIYGKLFLKRFDMAVALLSHAQTEQYAGYKKAKIFAALCNARNHRVYYVD